jgi:hypothetical protein
MSVVYLREFDSLTCYFVKQIKITSMVTIGNKVFTGNNVTISDNRIIIDGKDVTNQLPDQKEYHIQIDGNIEKLECEVCQKITVNGTVKNIKTLSGDVECKDVLGSIQTMSGNIDCENINGSVSTMSGNIKYKK